MCEKAARVRKHITFDKLRKNMSRQYLIFFLFFFNNLSSYLCKTFAFATQIVQSLFFLNLEFQASRHWDGLCRAWS